VSFLLSVTALLMHPRYMIGVIVAVSLGYMASEVTQALPNGAAEGAVIFVAYVTTNLLLTGRTGIEVFLLGYLLAVVRSLVIFLLPRLKR